MTFFNFIGIKTVPILGLKSLNLDMNKSPLGYHIQLNYTINAYQFNDPSKPNLPTDYLKMMTEKIDMDKRNGDSVEYTAQFIHILGSRDLLNDSIKYNSSRDLTTEVSSGKDIVVYQFDSVPRTPRLHSGEMKVTIELKGDEVVLNYFRELFEIANSTRGAGDPPMLYDYIPDFIFQKDLKILDIYDYYDQLDVVLGIEELVTKEDLE